MTYPMLYVFDIDGTLLTSKHEILPSTHEGISLLTERARQIMLASARPPKAIEPIIKELGLEPFYISLNGAMVVKRDEVLFEEPMGFTVTQEVISRALAKGLSVNVYTSWDWFIPEVNYWSTREGKIVGYQGVVRDLTTVEKAHKLLLIGEPDVVLKLQQELEDKVHGVTGSQSSPHYLEVVASGVSKAHALEVVSELLDIPLKKVAAFGDGENDLSMLQVAGYGVAMGNAHPALKEQAHLVTASNDQDGILQSIQEILHLRGV